jgi:hypothetical protein
MAALQKIADSSRTACPQGRGEPTRSTMGPLHKTMTRREAENEHQMTVTSNIELFHSRKKNNLRRFQISTFSTL